MYYASDKENHQFLNGYVYDITTDTEIRLYEGAGGASYPPDVAHGYTVVWPHGGPQAAERRAFRPFFQYLLSRGYNLFAPNFRGSTGYGATFVKQVERDWGHGPRLDIMEGVEWLIRQGKADRSKLVPRRRQLRRVHDAAAARPPSGVLASVRGYLRTVEPVHVS
ncbi:hypothetical protein GCM10025857_29420 [Alicyclobacillus contaminans]|nr:prolyl oligopeptidase family serine peptidase [Alicyclobacillus contaminans]GMA51585.1 hypothetical protein GCM10025857_29420 [Alicyclobacillus contaminans]